MKIKPDHYEYLEKALKEKLAGLSDSDIQKYRDRDIPRGDKVEDIDKRFRWDLLFACGLGQYLRSVLYPYLDDVHIDTVLRRIVPKLDDLVKPYTVVLLYPLDSTNAPETYITAVASKNAHSAAVAALEEAESGNAVDGEATITQDEFAVLAVFDGDCTLELGVYDF